MSVYSIAIAIWATVSAYIAIASGAPIMGLVAAFMVPIFDSYIGDRYGYSVAGVVAFAYMELAEFVGQSISSIFGYMRDLIVTLSRVIRTFIIIPASLATGTSNWTLLSAIGINLAGVFANSNLRLMSEGFHQALELFSESTVVAKPPKSIEVRKELTRILR